VIMVYADSSPGCEPVRSGNMVFKSSINGQQVWTELIRSQGKPSGERYFFLIQCTLELGQNASSQIQVSGSPRRNGQALATFSILRSSPGHCPYACRLRERKGL
jgi:hypothetical protein